MKKKIKEFKLSLSNLRYWFPIVWKDRPWDWTMYELILLHKFKDVAQYYSEGLNIWHANPKKVKADIDRVVELLQKLVDNNYFNDAHLNGSEPAEIAEFVSKRQEATQLKLADRMELYTIIAQNVEDWWD